MAGCVSKPTIYRKKKPESFYCHESFNNEAISQYDFTVAGVYFRNKITNVLESIIEYTNLLYEAKEAKHPNYKAKKIILKSSLSHLNNDQSDLRTSSLSKLIDPALLEIFKIKDSTIRYMLFVVILRNDEAQSTGSELDRECYYAERRVDLGAQVYDTVTSTMVWEREIQKHLASKRCISESECESDADRCIDMIVDKFICSLIDSIINSMQGIYLNAPSLKPILISAFGHISGNLSY